MQRFPLSQVAGFEIGTMIPSTSGVITRIGKRKTGNNAYGEWQIQDLDLADGPTKVKVKLFNHDEVPRNWLNQAATILSGEGKKGLEGVTLVEDDYKKDGSTMIDVRGKSGASIGLDFPPQQSAPAQQQAQAPRSQVPATTGSPPATKTPQKSKQELAVENCQDCLKAVSRQLNAVRIILRGLDYLAKERQHAGNPMSAEHYRTLCQTLLIEMNKRGQADALPHGNLEKYLPSQKHPDPADQDGNDPGEE